MLNDRQIDDTQAKNIYRFRSSTDYNYQALLEKKIYASTPNILNDPLDCGITYSLDVLFDRLKTKKRFIDYLLSSSFEWDFKELLSDEIRREEGMEDYLRSAPEDVRAPYILKKTIDVIAKTIIHDLRDCFGVVSFTLNPGNSVMWSHYASNFTGFVLGYDFKGFNKAVQKAVAPYQAKGHCKDLYGLHLVKYVSTDEIVDGTDLMYELILKRIAKNHSFETMIEFVTQSKNYQLFLSLLITKDKSWEYEREVRLILPREDDDYLVKKVLHYSSAPYFAVSDQYAPDEIIIGMDMSKSNRAIIGYYCLTNDKTSLWTIDDSRMMSERSLYKKLIKPSDILKR